MSIAGEVDSAVSRLSENKHFFRELLIIISRLNAGIITFSSIMIFLIFSSGLNNYLPQLHLISEFLNHFSAIHYLIVFSLIYSSSYIGEILFQLTIYSLANLVKIIYEISSTDNLNGKYKKVVNWIRLNITKRVYDFFWLMNPLAAQSNELSEEYKVSIINKLKTFFDLKHGVNISDLRRISRHYSSINGISTLNSERFFILYKNIFVSTLLLSVLTKYMGLDVVFLISLFISVVCLIEIRNKTTDVTISCLDEALISIISNKTKQ